MVWICCWFVVFVRGTVSRIVASSGGERLEGRVERS